ncbi:SPOR domain-containing protein [Thermocrinis sp.]|jgi:DedD protein|uniref:SPOR domain-containing protein n=1 Tax=Thermocrinis sp. TaxID=2024383 RepID=UPI003C08A77F
MTKETLLILLGILAASISFKVGLNKWLESKPESVPPPVVVRPNPPQPVQLISSPQEEKAKGEPKAEEKKQTPPPEPQKQKEDLIAKNTKEKKTKEVQKTQRSKNLTAQKQATRKEVAKQKKQAEKPRREVKEYVIQIGTFSSKEKADRALKKAISMGYRAEIVREGKLYKVRVRVKTDNPKKVLARLRSAFGSATIKR